MAEGGGLLNRPGLDQPLANRALYRGSNREPSDRDPVPARPDPSFVDTITAQFTALSGTGLHPNRAADSSCTRQCCAACKTVAQQLMRAGSRARYSSGPAPTVGDSDSLIMAFPVRSRGSRGPDHSSAHHLNTTSLKSIVTTTGSGMEVPSARRPSTIRLVGTRIPENSS